jgi:hypothetical protein
MESCNNILRSSTQFDGAFLQCRPEIIVTDPLYFSIVEGISTNLVIVTIPVVWVC